MVLCVPRMVVSSANMNRSSVGTTYFLVIYKNQENRGPRIDPWDTSKSTRDLCYRCFIFRNGLSYLVVVFQVFIKAVMAAKNALNLVQTETGSEVTPLSMMGHGVTHFTWMMAYVHLLPFRILWICSQIDGVWFQVQFFVLFNNFTKCFLHYSNFDRFLGFYLLYKCWRPS